MTAVRGALIDLYGTLVPVGPRALRAVHLREMAGVLGVEPSTFDRDWAASLDDRSRGLLGPLETTVRQIAGRQGVRPSEEAVRKALEIRLAFSERLLASSAEVLPALDALRAAGVRLAVVSNATEETPRLWSSSPLAARFDACVFSSTEGFAKPDPRMFRLGWERLGLVPSDCAFVGDGDSRELTAAAALGLRAYFYRCPGQATAEEYRHDPDRDWAGPSLADLRDLVNV